MVLEKRSLVEVSLGLYKEVTRLDLKTWMRERECSEVSRLDEIELGPLANL